MTTSVTAFCRGLFQERDDGHDGVRDCNGNREQEDRAFCASAGSLETAVVRTKSRSHACVVALHEDKDDQHDRQDYLNDCDPIHTMTDDSTGGYMRQKRDFCVNFASPLW